MNPDVTGTTYGRNGGPLDREPIIKGTIHNKKFEWRLHHPGTARLAATAWIEPHGDPDNKRTAVEYKCPGESVVKIIRFYTDCIHTVRFRTRLICWFWRYHEDRVYRSMYDDFEILKNACWNIVNLLQQSSVSCRLGLDKTKKNMKKRWNKIP